MSYHFSFPQQLADKLYLTQPVDSCEQLSAHHKQLMSLIPNCTGKENETSQLCGSPFIAM